MRARNFLPAAVFTALCLFLSCVSTPVNPSDSDQIPNLRAVDLGIWRGGQPTQAGWLWLSKVAGVSNVVKLNELQEGSDAGAVALGMTVNYHPVDVIQQLTTGPDDQDFKLAVSQIGPGTFVHCGSDARTRLWLKQHNDMTSGGNDRTGLAIGVYRLQKDGWPKDQAWNEMKTNGFHEAMHGLREYWEHLK